MDKIEYNFTYVKYSKNYIYLNFHFKYVDNYISMKKIAFYMTCSYIFILLQKRFIHSYQEILSIIILLSKNSFEYQYIRKITFEIKNERIMACAILFGGTINPTTKLNQGKI